MNELHTVALGKNGLASLPRNLDKMLELRELDLFMNKLRSVEFDSIVPKLNSLHLRANRLAELSATLERLPSLTQLDVSNNKIESLTPLSQLGKLTKLESSSCRLHNLSVFATPNLPLCKSISVLNVSCNRQITNLCDLQTPNLTELRAVGCSIDRVASKLEVCVKLRIMDLDGNPLRSLELNCVKLEILGLCNSKLHNFPRLERGQLLELATANARIKTLPLLSDVATACLKRLYLQGNNVSEIRTEFLNSLTV
jgi:Leucine-rich repeat (LRR) protein